MGSFRTLDDRARVDQDVLTAADRAADVAPDEWLAEGESIRYWTRTPHGVAARIASAATHATVDARGRVSGTYDVGAASTAKLVEGIVDWTMTDAAGNPVTWDRKHGASLLDGLPTPVLKALGEGIGRLDKRQLAAPADDEKPDGETEGNA